MQPRYNTDISVREDRDNFYSNNSHSHDGNKELLAPSQSSNVPTIKKSIPIKLSSNEDSTRNRSPETYGNSSQKSSRENSFSNSPRNSPTTRTMSPNNSSPRTGGSPTSSTTILSNVTAPTTSNNLEAPFKTFKDQDTTEMKLEHKSLREQHDSGGFTSSPTTVNSPTKTAAISPAKTQLQVVNVAMDLNSDNNMSIVEDENLQIHSIGTKLSKTSDSKYPIIHICPSCSIPVAMFARLVPCQHMCCYPCSQASNCYFCNAKITDATRIPHDPTLLGGGIFICEQDNCKRSYLSEYSLTEHQRLRSHGPYQGTTPAASTPSAASSTSSTSSTSSKSSSQSQNKSSSSGSSSNSSSSSKQTASPPQIEVDKHSHTKSHSQTIRSNSERDSYDSKRRPNNEPNPNHNNYPKNGDPMDYYAHPDHRSSSRGNRPSNFNKQPHKQHDPRYNPYY